MGRSAPPPLRWTIAALLLLAVVLPLRLPACAPQVCQLDEAARGACHELDGGCCQQEGERAAPAAPALAPAGPAVRPLPPLTASSPAPLLSQLPAAPAVMQGLGLHTLFSVFLI